MPCMTIQNDAKEPNAIHIAGMSVSLRFSVKLPASSTYSLTIGQVKHVIVSFMIICLFVVPVRAVSAAGPKERITEQSFYDFERAKNWWSSIKTRDELDELKYQMRKPFGWWTPTRPKVEAYKNDPSYDDRKAFFDLITLIELWKQIEVAGISSWVTPAGLIPGAEPTPWGVFSEVECERVSNLNLFSGSCLSIPSWADPLLIRKIDKTIKSVSRAE